MHATNPKILFFGTSSFSVYILETLKEHSIVPIYIVTTPDQPKGRKLILTPSPVKEWAIANNIPFSQPKSLKDADVLAELQNINADLFLVASYGKIIPQVLLSIPPKGSLNIHPSLLPAYRGPSPIQSQIVHNESIIGTSIMLMDDKVDHGPIIAQEKIILDRTDGELKQNYSEIEQQLANTSANLFVSILPKWIEGSITPQTQNDNDATFTSLLKKEDGLITIPGNDRENYRKYLAYSVWPGIYYMEKKNTALIRVRITEAVFSNGMFTVKKVVPEGKKEMNYSDFLKGLKIVI